LLPIVLMFELLQLRDLSDPPGGSFHSLKEQLFVVFAGGLNGRPSITICAVVSHRSPFDSWPRVLAEAANVRATMARTPVVCRSWVVVMP
jgi:hypothetical protein